MNRVRNLKFILWVVTGLAAAVAVARYLYGLGATTNLSDSYPWGLWVGFDVMGGVALASGGFIITAAVYIFKLERFHGIVRPAVLTAFLDSSSTLGGAKWPQLIDSTQGDAFQREILVSRLIANSRK